MNHNNNYIMPLNISGGLSNNHSQLQHFSKTNPAKTTHTNSQVCKNEMTISTSSSHVLTKCKKSSSCVTCPTAKTTNCRIPEICVEPPSDGMVLQPPSEWDLPGDLKRKRSDFVGRSQPVNSAETSPSADFVTLPGRYIRRLSEADEIMASPDGELDTLDEDILTREKDLSTALKWIRQEILHMKEQDRSLLKQFIQLQDSILQLRSLYDMHGSCSDVSSLDGSTYSLNEQVKSPRLHRLKFEGRNCLNKHSLSLPNSPRVSRFKWGSEEII